MPQKWVELFTGLSKGVIPFDGGGYIMNVNFSQDSEYTIFEVIGFKNVKNIYQSEDAVTFQSDGYKIFLVYEPRSYTTKYIEPYLRPDPQRIPLRWNELHIIELPNRDRIFVSREPYVSHGSFNVEQPSSGSFVYFLYDGPEIDQNAHEFLEKILRKDFQLNRKIIEEVQALFQANLKHFQMEAEPA
ncbi:MAG: hypothetical protein NXI24_10675 [bacterium]|nr:hypothetical protein [bacterium]